MAKITDTETLTMAEQLAQALAENAALKAKAAASRPFGMKVSEKGALSVYGVGRFPVTLYKEQWVYLFSKRELIEKFLAEHGGELKVKPIPAPTEKK